MSLAVALSVAGGLLGAVGSTLTAVPFLRDWRAGRQSHVLDRTGSPDPEAEAFLGKLGGEARREKGKWRADDQMIVLSGLGLIFLAFLLSAAGAVVAAG